MTYLISIAIGPVQEFIASARRSRDLWFGSWLLSELSKAAAKAIYEQGGRLIFPSVKPHDLEPNSPFSVVNKIVAEIEVPASEDLKKLLAETVYCAMQKRLRCLRNEALIEAQKHQIKGKPALNWVNTEAQIDDLIEYYWAAEPFNDPAQYATIRRRVEALLTARKSTRNFRSSADWNGYLPKSSLDGLRESVIDEAVYDEVKSGKRSEQWLRLTFGVRAGERLCGIGLLKRLGQRGSQDSFFSTSHVAALPLLKRLDNKIVVEDLLRELTKTELLGIIDPNEIKRELGHVPRTATLKPHPFFCSQDGSLLYDGRLLFEERMRELWPTTTAKDKDKRDKAKAALKKFFKNAFGDETIRPLPYYAILHADGDHMGAVIELLAEQGIQKHRALSAVLSEFAGLVKSVVETNHDGSCIYAGGDDVLAFVPLHQALDCARALATLFKSRMEASGLFADDKIKPPTLSVGLAVGHHLDPLQDTLELARDAEKIAKTKVDGKNALAVTVSKRSGIDRTAKGSWCVKTKGGSLYQRLNYFIYLHLSDELPDSAAYDLHDVSLRLKPPANATDEQIQTLWKAQCAEAKRILERKQPKHGKQKKLSGEVIGKLLGMVKEHDLPLNQLAEEIIIARLFAQGIEKSGIGKEEAKAWAEQHGIKPTTDPQTANNQEEEPK